MQYFIFLSTFFILLGSSSSAQASTFPTSNVCEIEAEVVDMQKRWIADAEPELGMYIQLSLKVQSVGKMIRKYDDQRSCQEAFNVGKKIKAGEYERLLLGNAQTLDVGQNIRAAIVSYIKGNQIRPRYVFQAKADDQPLVEVLSVK